MNKIPPTESNSTAGDDASIGRALRSSLLLAAIVALVVAIWWFRWKGHQPPSPPLPTYIPLEPPSVPPPRFADKVPFEFEDVTQQAGLNASVPNGATGQKLLPETMAGGCAVFDYDSDGDQDILTIGNSPWQDEGKNDVASVRLYQNDGSGHFSDVTHAARLDFTLHGMGAAAADYNNDGLMDVFLSGVGTHRLLRNRGGWFEDVTAVAGITKDSKGWSTGCGWWDYDHDGDVDLFVANYVAWSREIDLKLECTVSGVGRSYCRPELFAGSHLHLYRNDGADRFTDVSDAAGLIVRDRYTNALVGKSLGLTAVDLDLDGWLDIIVTNDTTQNFVFHNQRNGAFREIGAQCGLGFDATGQARRQFGVDAAWMAETGGWGVACGTAAGEPLGFFKAARGLLQFTDDSMPTGLGRESRVPNKFAPLMCDFDLDGRLDLFIANGQVDAEMEQLRSSQTHAQYPDLYSNIGDGRFAKIPVDKLGSIGGPIVARGAAIADFDGDADPDVLLVANGGPLRLLRNQQLSGNHWYRVRVSGPEAIGARVELTVRGTKQIWLASPYRGYLSQSEAAVTFGLGTADRIEHLKVYWTDGETWDRENLPADQTLVLSGSGSMR
jgi:hypothetical protein